MGSKYVDEGLNLMRSKWTRIHQDWKMLKFFKSEKYTPSILEYCQQLDMLDLTVFINAYKNLWNFLTDKTLS